MPANSRSSAAALTTAGERWPDLAGALEGTRHVLPVRIYFEDTDVSGVVYHGAFVRFLERGRSDYLRLLDVGHDALARGDHGQPLAFAVRRLALEYSGSARIDDVIEIRTAVKAMSGARITLLQKVTRGDEVLVRADVEVAMINSDGRARRLPESVRHRLRAGHVD